MNGNWYIIRACRAETGLIKRLRQTGSSLTDKCQYKKKKEKKKEEVSKYR